MNKNFSTAVICLSMAVYLGLKSSTPPEVTIVNKHEHCDRAPNHEPIERPQPRETLLPTEKPTQAQSDEEVQQSDEPDKSNLLPWELLEVNPDDQLPWPPLSEEDEENLKPVTQACRSACETTIYNFYHGQAQIITVMGTDLTFPDRECMCRLGIPVSQMVPKVLLFNMEAYLQAYSDNPAR